MKTHKNMPWLVGILALPFIVIGIVAVCSFTVITAVVAALFGKLEFKVGK